MSQTGRPDFTAEDSVVVDQAQGISSPHRLRLGPDRLFIPYDLAVRIADYWVGNTLSHGFWALFSKRHFHNAWYYMRVQFATMCATRQIFGREAGPGLPPSAVLFDIRAANAYFIGGRPTTELEVTALLPATYDTALNSYAIKINRNNALLFINDTFRGVLLFGLQPYATIPEWDNVDPYVLGGTRSPSSAGPMMIGMEGAVVIQWTIYPNGIIAVDGNEISPLSLSLFTENTATQWDDLAIAAGSLTSHPIPIWGYDRKTLCFRANGAGTLDIQIYVINAWRSVSLVAILANTLAIEVLDFEAPIARCVFTPTAYPTTITEAVAYLS